MAVEAVTTNGLALCTFEESGIAKMLVPILDRLVLKLTASKVQVWTIDAYRRKMIATKQTFAGEMVLVTVDLCNIRSTNPRTYSFQSTSMDH